MCGRVVIFSYGQLGEVRGEGTDLTEFVAEATNGAPFSLLDLAGALVTEQTLDGVHGFVQRSRSTRVQLDPNLCSLTGYHLHVADFGAELRMLDAHPILALFQGGAGLTEEARVQRGHHGIVEREDLDGCIGHRFFSVGVNNDRNDLALADGGPEVVRDGQEGSND